MLSHHYGSPSPASVSYGGSIGSVTLSSSIGGYGASPPSYHSGHHRNNSGDYHSAGPSLSPKSAHHLGSNYEIHGSIYGNNGHNSGLMSGHHSQTVVHYAPQQAHHVMPLPFYDIPIENIYNLFIYLTLFSHCLFE